VWKDFQKEKKEYKRPTKPQNNEIKSRCENHEDFEYETKCNIHVKLNIKVEWYPKR